MRNRDRYGLGEKNFNVLCLAAMAVDFAIYVLERRSETGYALSSVIRECLVRNIARDVV
jgi:hypothetical protein